MKKKRKLKHKWVSASSLLSTETATYLVCKGCGYVQNENNIEGACRGKIKMRAPEKPMKDTKMNAKEAKVTAQKRAEAIKKQREDREAHEAEAHAKKWREEKADWLKYEMENFAHLIKEAVEKGQTSTTIHVDTHDKEEWAEEKTFWENFSYRTELKKVIAYFEELGYTIEYKVKPYREIDLSDLNPRDDWYTYKSILRISW